MNDKEKDNSLQGNEPMNRRKAIEKMGYAAFASTTMLLLLNNPTRAQGTSGDPGDIGDDPFGDNPAKTGDAPTQKANDDPWKQDEDPWK